MIERVVDEAILLPISPEKPCGDDLRAMKEWVEIRKAKPSINDLGDKRDWEPANPVKTDWSTYKSLVEKSLTRKSKDLELGVFLTDACVRLYGFTGMRDGLWAVRGLLDGFADKGLFPLPEENDLEVRYGKLEWMNEKLAEVVRGIPLTLRPSPAMNYSLNYRNEALRPNGIITMAEFESAVAAGKTEDYQALAEEIREARAELQQFEQAVSTHFGPEALSFGHSRQALEECAGAVDSVLRKRSGAAISLVNGGGSAMRSAAPGLAPLPYPSSTETAANDSWAEAEHKARSGDLDSALASMAALAAAEPNGRVRFQRKLLLADICLQTKRKKLARSILEELNELVEQHKLTSWETSDLVGAVWARLVQCYREPNGSGGGNPERASEFFLKLSRLDPWQALAIGELPEQE